MIQFVSMHKALPVEYSCKKQGNQDLMTSLLYTSLWGWKKGLSNTRWRNHSNPECGKFYIKPDEFLEQINSKGKRKSGKSFKRHTNRIRA